MTKLDRIIVVCGCARCGTTMMMRMLEAGGVEVVCDNRVSYEDHRAVELPSKSDWIKECVGKAVKVLDPHHFVLPQGYNYWFIWMCRNAAEQARSQIKFLRACGVRAKKSNWKAMAEANERDNAFVPGWLARAYPASRVTRIEFEDVLRDPQTAARGLASSLGLALDVGEMAKVVDRRGPRCLSHMAETARLRSEGTMGLERSNPVGLGTGV